MNRWAEALDRMGRVSAREGADPIIVAVFEVWASVVEDERGFRRCLEGLGFSPQEIELSANIVRAMVNTKGSNEQPRS